MLRGRARGHRPGPGSDRGSGRLDDGGLSLVEAIVGFVPTRTGAGERSRLLAAAERGAGRSILGAYLRAVWTGLFGFEVFTTKGGDRCVVRPRPACLAPPWRWAC